MKCDQFESMFFAIAGASMFVEPSCFELSNIGVTMLSHLLQSED